MNKGKEICETLKEIRQQIADKNEIEYAPSECNFQGECKGTCPKCESEVRYLEKELYRRSKLKKAVSIAGISLGVVLTVAACKDDDSEEEGGNILGDMPVKCIEDSLHDNFSKDNTVFIEDLENEDK